MPYGHAIVGEQEIGVGAFWPFYVGGRVGCGGGYCLFILGEEQHSS